MLAFFMAFLMFLTSTGLSVDMHYCGHKLKTVSLISTADPCYKDSGECPSSPSENNQMAPSSCCRNHTLTLDSGAEEYAPSSPVVLQKINAGMIAVLTAVILPTSGENTAETHKFLSYKPPLPDRDIPVLCQSFLI